MPKKGYKQSEEHRKKVSKINKGRKRSEEFKNKISKTLKGIIPKNIDIIKSYWKGKRRSEETKRKISETQKGRIQPPELVKKRANSNKGKKRSEETKRKISEALTGKKRPNMSGEKNPHWNNGSSFEPYGLEFNKDLKEIIRNRDRRKCQLCEKTELENNKKLDIHHIDYNKKNNNPNNLISLCRSCHIKTNYDRKYWINKWKNN